MNNRVKELTEMQPSELKIGQIVVDPHDNEYEVLNLDSMPYYVTLKCVKFVKAVQVSKDVYVKDVWRQVVNVINTKYLEAQYGASSVCPTQYLTIEVLSPKTEYALNEASINRQFNDILDKVSKLDQYNSDENAAQLTNAIYQLRDELLKASRTSTLVK